MGWTWQDVQDLPEDIYTVLVDDLVKEGRHR